MTAKPINPKWHALIDYVLAGSLLTLPSLLGMNNKAKLIYAGEALILLPYIALTKQPVAIKGLIPIETHGKIDPFNVAHFALQTFLKPFHKTKKELVFNLAFTAIAGSDRPADQLPGGNRAPRQRAVKDAQTSVRFSAEPA